MGKLTVIHQVSPPAFNEIGAFDCLHSCFAWLLEGVLYIPIVYDTWKNIGDILSQVEDASSDATLGERSVSPCNGPSTRLSESWTAGVWYPHLSKGVICFILQ